MPKKRDINLFLKDIVEEITTKDLLEMLGEDFKKTLRELSFDNAAKGYEKLKNAELNRIFIKQIDWCGMKNIMIEENWFEFMKETKGSWRKHPIFKEMDDAVEIVNWMRGKEAKNTKTVMKK